jgi:hypothetical protein
MSQKTYNLNNIDQFMNDMYNVFLNGKIKPVQLIVAKSSNKTNTTHFLDFAFKLLKSIKIHAKFIFHINIDKKNEADSPIIQIELLSMPPTYDKSNVIYQITNPDKHKILLNGNPDSYVINEILNFDIDQSNQIQIQSYSNNKKEGHIIENTNDNNTSTENIMSTLLHKNYQYQDMFTVNIYLEYTKVNAQTIIITSLLFTK